MQIIYDMKMLGGHIRETRKAQKLTQEQLSATCGVGVRFLREVEQGKESCQIAKVFLVMQMLGIEVIVAKRGEFRG